MSDHDADQLPESVTAEHRQQEAALEAEPHPNCELCGSTGELCYPDLQDRHFDAAGTWSHLQCPKCHLVWLNPRPTPGDLARLYSEYYTHGEPEEHSMFVQAILRGIPAATQGYSGMVSDPWVRRIGRLLSLFGPLRELGMRSTLGISGTARGTLLDFGCGDGSFLVHMRSLGWSVAGVEQDPQAANVARELIGHDAIHGSLEEARAAVPDGYDVITLSHVIEHLLEPVATLRECFDCLRPGGKLVIATPNTASRGHKHFGRNWLHLDPPRHISLHNASTLTEVTRRAGFRVEKVETPASSSHFVYQASALLEMRGALPGIRVEDVSAWTLLESAVFWMWEFTLTRLGARCGEELLLTAEVPNWRE